MVRNYKALDYVHHGSSGGVHSMQVFYRHHMKVIHNSPTETDYFLDLLDSKNAKEADGGIWSLDEDEIVQLLLKGESDE